MVYIGGCWSVWVPEFRKEGKSKKEQERARKEQARAGKSKQEQERARKSKKEQGKSKKEHGLKA